MVTYSEHCNVGGTELAEYAAAKDSDGKENETWNKNKSRKF
jgi:hypothetical protein